jgi:hypothetical protein
LGISEQQAVDLRRRLASFAEDWERPEWRPMTGYHRSDVVLVLVLDAKLRTYKRRPALIVQADGLVTVRR